MALTLAGLSWRQVQAGEAALGAVFNDAKEQLRSLPHPLTYGLLRYLNPEVELPGSGPTIGFNYLGRLSAAETADTADTAEQAWRLSRTVRRSAPRPPRSPCRCRIASNSTPSPSTPTSALSYTATGGGPARRSITRRWTGWAGCGVRPWPVSALTCEPAAAG
ncbi:linear gramicidin synthetase subunit D domain protein [Mycobacterium xenopi 3993]|nr:linear gramicidin synthetase subunit D domain protein [Mycobacterium xenopi 3993]